MDRGSRSNIRQYLQRSYSDISWVRFPEESANGSSRSNDDGSSTGCEKCNSKVQSVRDHIVAIQHAKPSPTRRIVDLQRFDQVSGKEPGFAVLWVRSNGGGSDELCAEVTIHAFRERCSPSNTHDHHHAFDLQAPIVVNIDGPFSKQTLRMHSCGGFLAVVADKKVYGIFLDEERKVHTYLCSLSAWPQYQAANVVTETRKLVLFCVSSSKATQLTLTATGWIQAGKEVGIASNCPTLLVNPKGLPIAFCGQKNAPIFLYEDFDKDTDNSRTSAEPVTAAANVHSDRIVIGSKDGKVAIFALNEKNVNVWTDGLSEPIKRIEVVNDNFFVACAVHSAALFQIVENKVVRVSTTEKLNESHFSILQTHIPTSLVTVPFFLLNVKASQAHPKVELLTFCNTAAGGTNEVQQEQTGVLKRIKKIFQSSQQLPAKTGFFEKVPSEPVAVYCEGFSRELTNNTTQLPLQTLPLDSRLHAFVVWVNHSTKDDLLVLRDSSVYDGLEQVLKNN